MGKYFWSILPMALMAGAVYLKGRDANDTGPDDAFGNVMMGIAPAVESYKDGNESATRKSLKAARDSIDAYLATPVPQKS
jgi:hypothetical protein